MAAGAGDSLVNNTVLVDAQRAKAPWEETCLLATDPLIDHDMLAWKWRLGNGATQGFRVMRVPNGMRNVFGDE
jgi:hypothetical protein